MMAEQYLNDNKQNVFFHIQNKIKMLSTLQMSIKKQYIEIA